MSLFEKMTVATADIWAEYYVHPFVKGIEDGTLDKEKFRYYIKQDYLYLMEYTKVFGIGVEYEQIKEENLLLIKDYK